MKFQKKYQTLMEQYSLNEGLFSVAGNAIKTALKDAVVSPFKDPKFNPFAGKSKPIDTSEAGNIISKIEEEWMDLNKKITFNFKDETGTNKTVSLSYSDIREKEGREVDLFKKLMSKK